MTAISMEKVGLIAHYSEQGDWAFDAAFEFARESELQLNTFFFLKSSFDMPQKARWCFAGPLQSRTAPLKWSS